MKLESNGGPHMLHNHEPKMLTPSEPAYSEEDSIDSDDCDVFDSNLRSKLNNIGSDFDTCATASLVEGHT